MAPSPAPMAAASMAASSLDLPQEVLIRIFHFLPIKQRSQFACVSRAWREAAVVDAVQCKLSKHHVPSYLHVALPDAAAQLSASACPIMSLARSADLMWAPVTGRVLESMPSLERLAFSSMGSGSLPSEGGGLNSLRSLTNLQSLQMNIADPLPVLEAMPSVPSTIRELELHLHGDDWSEDVLERITKEIGAQAAQLRHLVLRCSHASVYRGASQHMQALTELAALTSLRIGPNPEDADPKASPLGFPRLPDFLAAMTSLRYLDISMADAASAACISYTDLSPIARIPRLDLTLRADTSIREIYALPASLTALTGLTRLAVHSFAFEDPGGWSTSGCFDVSPAAPCKALRRLELRLRTWGAEHCEAFQLLGLEGLHQLTHLEVSVAAPLLSLPQGPAAPQVPELRMTLPGMRPSSTIRLAASMRLVLRNSKVLARCTSPAVLAHSILLEEALRTPAAPAPAPAPSPSPASSSGRAPAPVPSCAAAGAAPPQPQQYVRAAVHVVIGALRHMWPGTEVWQYPMKQATPCSGHVVDVDTHLLCNAGQDREALRSDLLQLLEVAGAGPAPLKKVQIA